MPESVGTALVSLLTLTLMEIVLGIDNIVFISILVDRLPRAQRAGVRRTGLVLALVMRIGLLLTITWIMRLVVPLFTVFGRGISGRDLILLGGGLFLMAKASHEIYDKLEVGHDDEAPRLGAASAGWMLAQIVLLDIVFSLDSVITAVGLSRQLWVMITAMMVAVGVMLVFAGMISDFITRHPSMRVLALAFLILIGVLLVAESFGQHLDRGYVYFAMAFSLGVELLNMRLRRTQQAPVKLHAPEAPPGRS